MSTIDILCIAIGIFCGTLAHEALDQFLPRDVRCYRVGGLVHWRFGRVGGSFYFAKER